MTRLQVEHHLLLGHGGVPGHRGDVSGGPKTYAGVESPRSGVLVGDVEDDAVIVEADGAERRVPLADITKAVVQVELNRAADEEGEDN